MIVYSYLSLLSFFPIIILTKNGWYLSMNVKLSMCREIARMLADDQKKRVVIVDTSNEIGGDGDVPHSGIGCARRMQVPNVNLQHNVSSGLKFVEISALLITSEPQSNFSFCLSFFGQVMIEAVENHMPQTIIIDEIGTELEALAASTIAQRGVQLVGTAHGTTIESIIKNPSLQMLVGGIEVLNPVPLHSDYTWSSALILVGLSKNADGCVGCSKSSVLLEDPT